MIYTVQRGKIGHIYTKINYYDIYQHFRVLVKG